MAKETLAPSEKNLPIKPGLKVRIVSYTDYLQEARELLLKGPVNGMDDIWNVAISLLYAKNNVIGIVQKSGETRFVVEA